jgi:hypothetical protein
MLKETFAPAMLPDELAGAACREQGMDPEWWVGEHISRLHLGCPHQLARHICLTHCPVMAQCKEIGNQDPPAWVGMTIGGVLRTATRVKAGRPARVEVVLLPPKRRCHLCPEEPPTPLVG